MENNSEEVALLVAQGGPLNGLRWALHQDTIIGRESGCDIVIADRQVSRHHAQLTIDKGGIQLEDLGSKNGTHHNGESISISTLLQDGDIIQIALAQQFIFLSSDSTVPLDGDLSDLVAIQTGEPQVQKPELRKMSLEKRSRRVWIHIGDSEDYQKVEILPPLSASQFRLLEALYKNQGRVIPRRELVEAVWGAEQAFEVSEQALDALVRRLRDRIADTDPVHAYVITVRGHGLRLPGLAIVAVLLAMADRLAEVNAVDGADGQQGDLVIELHEALDNHPAAAGAAALLGILPGILQVLLAAQQALPLAGRAHHRLDDAGITQCGRSLHEGILVVGEAVGGRL